MNKLIVANLTHRPVRSLISIIAVAMEVTLILVVVGILLGILNDTTDRQKAVGADALVRPPGSTIFLTQSPAPISIRVGDVIRRTPHVKIVVPVLLEPGSSATETIWGIDVQTFNSLGNPFRYVSGGSFRNPDDLLVDDYLAKENHLRVGDHLEVLNQDFRVCGIIEHGKGGRKFVPITTLQDMIGQPGKATVFFVKLDEAANYGEFKQALLGIDGMGRFNIMSMNEYLTLMRPENLRPLDISIKTVVGVALCIGFIVIFQSMYTAVMERTREIGILKSLGASRLYVMKVILKETVMLAVVGILLGTALSLIVQQSLKRLIPTLVPMFDPHWAFRAAVVALVGAILGALYPAYLAAQKDPVDALAYE